MKRCLIFWFCLFPLSIFSQDILLYEDALQTALQNNFDIQIAKSDKRISDNNYTRGNAGFLPSVQLTGGRNYSIQNVNQEFITGSENQKDNARSNTWSAGVDLSWTLFDGTKMFASYEKLGVLRELGGLEFKMAVENTVFNTTLAYYDIVLEKNRLTSLDSTLLLSKARLNHSKAEYEVGKAPKFEYLSAVLDYNSDSTQILKQNEILQHAKYQLNELMARETSKDFDVPVQLSIDTSFVLDELKQLALTQNSAILESVTTGRVLELEKKELNAERLPQLDLNVGYSYNKLSSQAGFLLSNKVHGLNYGVTASWWIFDGQQNKLQRQNLKVEQESLALRIEQLKMQVIKELEDNFLTYANNLNLIKLNQHNLALALENEAIAFDRYKLGKSSFLEFREAQVNVVNAYRQLFATIYETKVAELNMLLLSGQLLENN